MIALPGMHDARADVASTRSGMLLHGTMTTYDADLLETRLPRGGTLFLASPGGSLVAGLRIADMTRTRRITVVVEGDCASACSLPFFTAARRLMKPGTRVGVHSSSKSDGREDDETLATTARIVRVLADNGVPQTVVAGMVTATPDKIYWLSDNELEQLGAERTATSSEPTTRCTSYTIEAPAGYGRIRTGPSLSSSIVEELANGSHVKSCGESRTDERGVAWLRVTANSRDKDGRAVSTEGWMSQRVLAR